MVFLNYSTMQMVAKIVYYGPGLCGKTTNLKEIYRKTSAKSRGEMVSLETETDRTLFFDLLPMDVGVIGGFKTKFQLYTVPGQVFYNSTRKLVLRGVDGIVFVADSQVPMLDANQDSYENLQENLEELGLDIQDIPLVYQFNKRDLPNILKVETLNEALNDLSRPFIEASAIQGIGVFETLKEISKQTLLKLRTKAVGSEPKRKETVSLQVRSETDRNQIRKDIEMETDHGTVTPSEEHTLVRGKQPEQAPIPQNVSFDTYPGTDSSMGTFDTLDGEPPPVTLPGEEPMIESAKDDHFDLDIPEDDEIADDTLDIEDFEDFNDDSLGDVVFEEEHPPEATPFDTHPSAQFSVTESGAEFTLPADPPLMDEAQMPEPMAPETQDLDPILSDPEPATVDLPVSMDNDTAIPFDEEPESAFTMPPEPEPEPEPVPTPSYLAESTPEPEPVETYEPAPEMVQVDAEPEQEPDIELERELVEPAPEPESMMAAPVMPTPEPVFEPEPEPEPEPAPLPEPDPEPVAKLETIPEPVAQAEPVVEPPAPKLPTDQKGLVKPETSNTKKRALTNSLAELENLSTMVRTKTKSSKRKGMDQLLGGLVGDGKKVKASKVKISTKETFSDAQLNCVLLDDDNNVVHTHLFKVQPHSLGNGRYQLKVLIDIEVES